MVRRRTLSWISMLVALFCLVGWSTVSAAEWPTDTLELVVPWKAGGGSDTMARFITKAIKDNNLCSKPAVVVNKPGGNAQIGSAYVISKKGDPNVWMTLSSAQILSPIAGMGAIKASDFTPLAQMAADSFLLVVKADSKYKTVDDVVAAAKANPGGINIGGTGRGADDHLCSFLFESAAQIKLNYIAFSGGGEVMSNLLGGHIEMAWANPNECLSQVEGGLVRTLAVTTEDRLGGKMDCPTFKEAGYDVVFIGVRGIHGPPDMPESAVKASIALLREVSKTTEWQKGYIEAKYLQPKFVAGDDYRKVIERNEVIARKALKEMGVIK